MKRLRAEVQDFEGPKDFEEDAIESEPGFVLPSNSSLTSYVAYYAVPLVHTIRNVSNASWGNTPGATM